MKANQLVSLARKATEDKKGIEPVILKMGRHSSVASYFLVVHGTSDRHVKSIAKNVMEELEKKNERVWHCEGLRDGRWVLLDYGDVVVHVFHHEARKFYNLERLWGTPTAGKRRHARKS